MPIDGAGYFTRLFSWAQDRDDNIRILASRMDAEFDNLANAINADRPSTNITYNGQPLSTTIDKLLVSAGSGIAENVKFGVTNVAAELIALRGLTDGYNSSLGNRVAAQETRKYDASEITYVTGKSVKDALDDGSAQAVEGLWAPTDTPPDPLDPSDLDEPRFGPVLAIIRKPRIISLYEFMSDAKLVDATSGTPKLNIGAEMQAAVDYCRSNKYSLWIPEVFALVDRQIISDASVRVQCDSNSRLQWTNIDSSGWLVDGKGAGGRPGYCRVELPQLLGPNDISGYEASPKAYTVEGFKQSALTVRDCIWSDFKVQQSAGWGSGLYLTNTTVPTDNNTFELGTIDLCGYGLFIESAVGATAGIGQSRINTMNIFARNCVFLRALAGSKGIFDLEINALGMVVAETGGACIWHQGENISNVRGKGPVSHRYLSTDSPVGTPVNYRGPLIGGDGVVQGEGGWARGNRCTYDLSLDDFEPSANGLIATKLQGVGSHLNITNPPQRLSNAVTPVELNAAQGEAFYNSGLGGAAIHTYTRVVFTVVLAAGASTVRYFYHQGLNPENILPVQIVQLDNPTDLEIRTQNNGPQVKREVLVLIRNPTAGNITQTVNLWLKVP